MTDSITVNVTAPSPFIGQPTRVDGYLVVAHELLQGLEILSAASTIPPRAAVYIAAHLLECLLSAFLLHKGVDTRRDDRIWHDLVAQWETASTNGLTVERLAPDWVRILSEGHNRPFYFRYQRGPDGNVVHGGQTPELIPMTVELRKLSGMVDLAIKTRP